MNYTVEAAEKSTVKIVITFSGEEFETAQQKAYLKNRGRFVVNGYRKGKAPKKVIEMYYGQVFAEDAIESLYADNFNNILDENAEKFTAVGEPKLELTDMTNEQIVITAILPVKPEIELGDYTGLKIRKYAHVVDEAEVEAEINAELAKKSTLAEVEGRVAALGDVATIDFAGSVDGVLFEGGSGENYDLELGSNTFIPGFEDQVVGMSVEETKNVVVTFPENYGEASLAGKEAVFAVTLHKLSEKKLPELDEEFVKKYGCKTVEEYKAKVLDRLTKKAERENRDQTENSIVEAISANAKAVIPDAMIESQANDQMRNFETQLSYSGIKVDDYLKYVGMTRESLYEQYKVSAERNVLAQLVIDKIIRNENITATEEEIEASIAKDAASIDKDVAEYKKNMKPEQLSYVRNDIIITKLFGFLEANNEMYVEE